MRVFAQALVNLRIGAPPCGRQGRHAALLTAPRLAQSTLVIHRQHHGRLLVAIDDVHGAFAQAFLVGSNQAGCCKVTQARAV